MWKFFLGTCLALATAALSGCASDGGWSDGALPATECPPSASSYHEREGMPAVRPGDCRPGPVMRVPMRGDGKH